jgi:hypothetical protein
MLLLQVNSGFFFSNAKERESMVEAERKFTDEKVREGRGGGGEGEEEERGRRRGRRRGRGRGGGGGERRA